MFMAARGRARLAFRLIVLIPLLYLAGAGVELGLRLARLRSMDMAEVARLAGEVDRGLQKKRGLEMMVEDGDRSVSIQIWNSVWKRKLPLRKKTIVALGGSSLVWPTPAEAFPALVSDELGEAVEVLNLGYPGVDSFTVRSFATAALKRLRPALVMIYSGHNDYGYNYTGNDENPFAVRPAFFVIKGTYLLEPLAWPVQVVKGLGNQALQEIEFQGFLNRVVEPNLIKAARNAGFLRLPAEASRPVDLVVVKHYRANIRAVIAACRARGVPVLLMTLLGNLLSLPNTPAQADEHEFESLYGGSYLSGDPRLRKLVAIKDRDMFTFEFRAKSGLQNSIRVMGGPGVHVLDLEQRVLAGGISFQDSFEDHVHFTRDFHKRVARIIAAEITSKGLVP